MGKKEMTEQELNDIKTEIFQLESDRNNVGHAGVIEYIEKNLKLLRLEEEMYKKELERLNG